VLLFALVATRVAGLFIGAPALARRDVPARHRVALALALTGAMLPGLAPVALPEGAAAALAAFAAELLLGLALGLLARLALMAFELAGEITSTQMGLALGASYDPESGEVTPLLATLQLSLATLLFLTLDGHHALLRSVAASFQILPPGSALRADVIAAVLSDAFQAALELAVRVAAPVSGLLLLVNGLIGFLNRVTPQLSIFNVGFPLTVAVGFLATAASLPDLAMRFAQAYAQLEQQSSALLGF
jgi:flagellar biosynthetic protein FliR